MTHLLLIYIVFLLRMIKYFPGQIECGDPPPLNPPGQIELKLVTAQYICPEGQELDGPAMRTCKEDTKWYPGPEEETHCHDV